MRPKVVATGMDTSQLHQYRTDRDEFFGTSHDSPLPHEARHEFSGLRYYDANPELVFDLSISPGDGTKVTVQTSDGAARQYVIAGKVTFEVGGEPQQLTLYDTGHDGYFLPFRDATSGSDTYGAGRYLDLQPNADGSVTLDFNLAYNPFCAYNEAFSCPLPPVGNWLGAPIEAGELDFVTK